MIPAEIRREPPGQVLRGGVQAKSHLPESLFQACSLKTGLVFLHVQRQAGFRSLTLQDLGCPGHALHLTVARFFFLIMLLPPVRLGKSRAEGQPSFPLDKNPMGQLLGCPHPTTGSPVAGSSPLSNPNLVEKLPLIINQIFRGLSPGGTELSELTLEVWRCVEGKK